MPAEIFSAYPRIAAKVFGAPWMIRPEVHNVIQERLAEFVRAPQPFARSTRTEDPHAELNAQLIQASSPTRSAEWMVTRQTRRAAVPYNMDSGTKIGQVVASGLIGKGLSAFEMDCGNGVCVDHLQAAMEHLAELGAEKIALHISSPGGTVTGVPEFSAWMADFSENTVPVHAYTDTLCCSAGYYFAASAASFTAAPTADIGCIGVYSYMNDRSGEWEKLGRKAVLLTTGKFKGQGSPGVPMDEDWLKMLQEDVDRCGEAFFGHIIAHRGDKIEAEAAARKESPEEFARGMFQGQSWMAKDAPASLHDGFLPNRAAHLRELARAR